jgi:hypothetical protein
MRQVNIFVRDRIVRVEYQHQNRTKEIKWEDKQNLTRDFLLCLDKINICNRNNSNCLLRRSPIRVGDKSDSASTPITVVLHQEGRESTTHRIILVSLRALDWAGSVKLVTKS